MKKIIIAILTVAVITSLTGCVRLKRPPDELAFPVIDDEKPFTENVTVTIKPEKEEKEQTKQPHPEQMPTEKTEPPIVNEPRPSVTVPILMFHDVKTVAGGEWSMSADNFRNTLQFLKDNGYTIVSFDSLVDYVDKKSDIPEKPVCITLDDGYFSNYRNVLPIVTEMKVPVTVFMTCKTMREAGKIPPADENILCKMSAAELEIMQASPYVDIQSHTYDLHGLNTSYSEIERDFSLPLPHETEQQFKEIYAKDCRAADEFLAKIGERKHKVLSYPGGKYHEWTEQVLREQNYRVTVTSDDGRVNTVRRGDPDSLYLLGRMNVNDATAKETLLLYLERR